MSYENAIKFGLLLVDTHLSDLDTWCLLLCASSSSFVVKVWAEETIRIEWSCSSARRLLCDASFTLIIENNCSHMYMQTLKASEQLGYVTVALHREWSVQTQQYPGNRILLLVCHYIGARSVLSVCVMVRFPQQLQIGCWSAGTCFFALQNRQLGVRSWLKVGWVFPLTLHGQTRR